jgi:hypothetical protein
MKKYLLSFLDFQTCMLLAFASLFVLAALKMADENNKGNIVDPAEYIVELQWKDGSRNDIDLWVSGPGSNNLVYFKHPDSGLITLDRDDKGINNMVDGVSNPTRREVITLRKIIPGTYTVNVMMFKNNSGDTENPKVTIRRLNPYKEIVEKTVDLTGEGEEKTILNFELDEKGNVVSQDDTYTTLVKE